jgi:hypothetical protein
MGSVTRFGKALTDRQQNQSPAAIAVAWSAQQRLHRTWTRLEKRAKRRTIIAVAAARELAGFAWAGRARRSGPAARTRGPVSSDGGGSTPAAPGSG